MVVHALFPLKTLIGNVHSLLDVIKRCLLQKGCEDNSPIVIADLRDELAIFRKIKNIAPGSLSAKSFGVVSLLVKILLLVSFFISVFSENIFCIKIFFFLEQFNAHYPFLTSL
jgi:hypothetical protein